MKKRLVFVIPHLGRSGPTRQLTYLVTALNERYEVEVLAVQPEKSSSMKFEFDGLKVKLTLASKLTFVWCWARLLALAIAGRVDTFHSHGFLPDLLCMILLPKKKWVSVARNFPLADYPPKFGLVRGNAIALMHFFVHRRCVRLVCCSDALRVAYAEAGIQSITIRNAVCFQEVPMKIEQHNRTRRFVFLGNIIPRKRVDLTCRLFEALAVGEAELDIVGEGGELAKLKEKYRSNPSIHFHGNQTHVLPFLENGFSVINLSASEGMPNAVLEGLAAGCICILSDIGPHEEIRKCIGAGVIGITVSDASTDEELKTLGINVSKKLGALPDEQGQINRNRAKESFGIDRLAVQFEHHYENMVKRDA